MAKMGLRERGCPLDSIVTVLNEVFQMERIAVTGTKSGGEAGSVVLVADGNQ